ncbi:alpha/beta hydrolase [Spirillospora sp. CA-255316]
METKAHSGTLKRWLGASGAGLAVAAMAAPVPPALAADTPPSALAAYYTQRVTWTDCRQGPDDEVGAGLDQAGARCTQIIVPLDYTRPHGRTIRIALSRLPASDPARRIGALVLNHGGPAEPTLGMPLQTRTYLGDLSARYDLIGLDPRFVGRSTPLDCGWPVGLWIRSAGTDRAGFDRQVAFNQDLAERCIRRHGDVLPFATTRNTARDIDIVRSTLGEQQISYLGYSYGAYLGAVYAQMFPGRTDRMVLDSAGDPSQFGPRLLIGREPAAEQALHAWATWTAARHHQYGLGSTKTAVLATVHRIIQASSTRPLRVGPYTLDEHIVPYLVYVGVGNDRDPDRAAFATTMKALDQAANGTTVTPPPHLDAALSFYLTAAYSHYGSPAAAIICGDRAAPPDPETYWNDIQHSRNRHPLFGPITNNIAPCAFWPRPPREQPTEIANAARALIISATGDTATTYQGAQAAHRKMTGSRLLTLRDTIAHGIYGEYGNSCVDRNVNAYLASGDLPRNQTCRR